MSRGTQVAHEAPRGESDRGCRRALQARARQLTPSADWRPTVVSIRTAVAPVLIALVVSTSAFLVSRFVESVHSRRLRRLSHERRGLRPIAISWGPTRPNLARTNVADARHECQRDAVHLQRRVHRQRGGAESRQPEDRFQRAHCVAHRRSAGPVVHGAVTARRSLSRKSRPIPIRSSRRHM